MKAVADRWPVEQSVVMTIGAGADLAILGTLADVGPAFASLDEAVYQGQLAVERVNDAATNVLRSKEGKCLYFGGQSPRSLQHCPRLVTGFPCMWAASELVEELRRT